MNSDEFRFSGFVMYEGVDYLPKDLPIDVGPIRKWAYDNGLIYDYRIQFLAEYRANKLSEVFTLNDEPMLTISISEDEGELNYFEYLYLPVKTLIKKNQKIRIAFWKLMPSMWDVERNVTGFGEVRIGFWYPGTHEEIWTISNAIKVIGKFNQLVGEMPENYEKITLSDGTIEVGVVGNLEAKFYKEGKYFDVEFSVA
jgi:hypothetical protein